jgi:hypothetical protein
MRCVSTKMHTVSVSHIDGCSDVDGRSGLNLSKGNRLMWPSSEQVGFVAVRIGSVLSCGSGELNPASIYRLKLFHLVPASVVIFFAVPMLQTVPTKLAVIAKLRVTGNC